MSGCEWPFQTNGVSLSLDFDGSELKLLPKHSPARGRVGHPIAPLCAGSHVRGTSAGLPVSAACMATSQSRSFNAVGPYLGVGRCQGGIVAFRHNSLSSS